MKLELLRGWGGSYLRWTRFGVTTRLGDRGRKSTEYARQPLEPVSDGRNAWLGLGTKDARLVVVDPPSKETGEPETAQDDSRITGVNRWSYSRHSWGPRQDSHWAIWTLTGGTQEMDRLQMMIGLQNLDDNRDQEEWLIRLK